MPPANPVPPVAAAYHWIAVPVAVKLATVAEPQKVCALAVGADELPTTIMFGVVVKVALQKVDVMPVTKTLKVVVLDRFPVGNKIVPPVPATVVPTKVFPLLFLS